MLAGLCLILLYGALFTWFLYKILSKRLSKLTQTVRIDVLQHHSNKEGTPTMGGMFLLLPMTTLPFFTSYSKDSVSIMLAIIFFAVIGAIDDLIKIKRGKGQGLSAKHKMLFMLIASIIVLYLMSDSTHNFSVWLIPFSNSTLFFGEVLGWLGAVFIMLGTANAVNLTDGLDGLALFPAILALLALMIFACYQSNYNVACACALLIGSCITMLWYNVFPAKIFLGDMGSLGLGASIAILAINLKMSLMLIFIGWLFLVETISVILQVCSYKAFKKRIFRMSPLHHHFELLGWHESNVVSRLWVLAFIIALVTVMLEVDLWTTF